MRSKAQQKKAPSSPAKGAGQKTSAERQAETERRLAEDRRALEEHARKLDESVTQAGDLATERLAERLKPLKDKLRTLLDPTRAMDLALQRLEDARVGLEVPADAPALLDVLIEADPDTKWAEDAEPAAVERAALDLFDDLHRQCETLDAAIKKAENEAQAAFAKLVKPTREQQIPACLDTAKRLAQWARNRTALTNGRPLPFSGVGTADELHAAAKKALGAPLDLASKVRTAIDGLDIKAPAPAGLDDADILSDDTDDVEQPTVA